MPSSGSERDPVEQLADEFLERLRRGERPALTEYTQRYPQWAERIRKVFPALVLMEGARPEAEDRTGDDTGGAPVLQERRLERLGDYRILREVGRGGMGIVYEAEQVSLGRHVALKVLPQKLLVDPRYRRRFEREARAAARLHHTNIVPVFGVGEHEGLPYYVMQFIQGLGLDEVLDELIRIKDGRAPREEEPRGPGEEISAADLARSLMTGAFESARNEGSGHNPDVPVEQTVDQRPEAPSEKPSPTPTAADRLSDSSLSRGFSSTVLPRPSGDARPSKAKKQTYWQSVATLGVQVAGALEYAHQQGILHRDIKPSNLLLDRRGVVWITDFGLAKADDQQDLTHTGDILGTLRYMPPEAFEGKTDTRGDIYALGLALYELVAFRPAFREKDRHKLIKQVTSTEPSPLGKLNPKVPRDLETIIHKAMDRDPARRYSSASELAADLQRFLDDEPIRARPIGAWERTWRWCRRRPTAAALAAVSGVALLLAVGGGVGLWYHGQTQQARKQAETALKEKDRLQYFLHIALAHASWRDGNLFGVEQLLNGCPPQHRNWEWHYLQRLCHGDLLTLEGHPDEVRRVAFSPDGTRLAAVGFDQRVRVWDTTTGQLFQQLIGHTDYVRGVAFSPDGQRLASSGRGRDPTVRVWDLQSGQEIHTLKGHTGHVHSVAFSPDGKRLASGAAEVMIWEVQSGQRIHTFLEGSGDVAFSPDGKRLASCGWDGTDATVKVWDVQSGRKLRTLRGHPSEVWSVAFSPDGTLLLSGSTDGTVKVWDTATWQESRPPLKEHGGTTVCLSPDGTQFATAGIHPTVKVWSVATGEVLHTLKGHLLGAWGVAFSPDGTRLASASGDKTVKIWDATIDPEGSPLIGHRDHVRNVSFSLDGRQLASASSDGTVKVWDTTTRQLLRTFPGHARQVLSVVFSPDGRRLASASMDGTVRVWNVATDQEVLAPLPSSAGRVLSIAFSPDGRWLAFPGESNSVQIWDVSLNQRGRPYTGHTALVHGVGFSPDGRWLASASADKSVRIWDMATGRQAHELKGHSREVWIIAFSPDGKRLASSSWDGTAKIWDVRSGQLLHTLAGHTSDVMGVAFNQDGTRLATASNDGTVKIWDTTHGNLALTLTGHKAGVISVAFSPDGTLLASASEDHTVKIWDARPWTPEAALEREALGRLEFLFRKPLCKADVLDYLRNAPPLRPQAQQLALSLVDRYREETDPERYCQASWALLRQPYLNVFQYGYALRQAETAHRLAPDQGKYATTLGVAQYRARRYHEALATLTQAGSMILHQWLEDPHFAGVRGHGPSPGRCAP